MAFDVKELVNFAEKEVQSFAAEHSHETFYAFAIDMGMLCLNTADAVGREMLRLRKRYPDTYQQHFDSAVKNTGDWEYQGFGSFENLRGFDRKAASDWYDLQCNGATRDQLEAAPYARAMENVLQELSNRKAFDVLKRTPDFIVVKVDYG